ncbi:MAG TPA: group II truncated hemoglobin [Nitrospira sp.]|jgi:hemoglobin|nr:group II truncated hemoglobin [Nitrospira sp.]
MPLNEQGDSVGTTPYQAAGELDGITKLVDAFYVYMDTLPEAETIRRMHPHDLAESRKKLTYFLCGWLGGPKLFSQHYGPISIPGFHKQFPIGYEERDAWLLCMQQAIAIQPFSDSFKEFLLAALRIPAERVRQVNAGEI